MGVSQGLQAKFFAARATGVPGARIGGFHLGLGQRDVLRLLRTVFRHTP